MITTDTVHMRESTRRRCMLLSLFAGLLFVLPTAQAGSSSVERFLGHYRGESDTVPDGESAKRQMLVEIEPSKNGFTVSWQTTIMKTGHRPKAKGLSVVFVATSKSHTYASAMRRDMFGNPVPLDLMKGEPLVWATISGDTMTVYLLRILDDGSQDFQIDIRTRTADGLKSEFIGLYDGEPLRRIGATLTKIDK
jgi:hypothetical protein